MTQRLGFGVLLAPHHPIGEHPTLQFQRDLELAQGLIKPIEASAARVTADKEALMEKSTGAILKAIRDYSAVHPRQK